MVKFKADFILSVALHAAIVAAFFVFCMRMEIHVPKNFVVSLFEEKSIRESGFNPLSHTRQKQADVSPAEPPLPKGTDGEDENAGSQPAVKIKDTSEGKGDSMSISLDRQAGLSDIRNRPAINVPPGYSGIEHDGNNSGKASPDDLYSSIRDAIAKAKTYPVLARKRKIEGTVVTGFSIDDRGYPGNLKIRKSSGYEILDSAALKIVTRAAPFPKVDGQITVPITFKLTESTSSR